MHCYKNKKKRDSGGSNLSGFKGHFWGTFKHQGLASAAFKTSAIKLIFLSFFLMHRVVHFFLKAEIYDIVYSNQNL